MAITATGFAGTVNQSAWARLARYLGSRVGTVAGRDDFAVTASGSSLAVNVAPGTSGAHGVSVTSTAIEPVPLDAVTTSGQSRWDAIVLRRNWNTGAATLTKVNGVAAAGAPMVIPAGVVDNPGTQHDQILALVQVTNGSATPTAVVPFLGAAVSSTVLTIPSVNALPPASAALYGLECVVAGRNGRYRCDYDAASSAYVWVSGNTRRNASTMAAAATGVASASYKSLGFGASPAGALPVTWDGDQFGLPAGTYRVDVVVLFGSNATGYRELQLQLNPGSSTWNSNSTPAGSALRTVRQPPAPASSGHVALSKLVTVADSDRLMVLGRQASGGALNIGSTSAADTELTIIRQED